MLGSIERLVQVVVFVALTMHHKMDLAWKRQRQTNATVIHNPGPHHLFPTVFVASYLAVEKDDPSWSSTSESGL